MSLPARLTSIHFLHQSNSGLAEEELSRVHRGASPSHSRGSTYLPGSVNFSSPFRPVISSQHPIVRAVECRNPGLLEPPR
jgi:hypothetical protein